MVLQALSGSFKYAQEAEPSSSCLSSVCHSVAEKHHLLGGFLLRFKV